MKEKISSAPERVVLTWREKESYNEAVKIYPFVRNILVPDIAFQLGPFVKGQSATFDLLLFLRNDKESTLTRSESYIQSIIPKDVTYRVVDWPDQLKIFNTRDYFFTQRSVDLLSLGKVVVCDRYVSFAFSLSLSFYISSPSL